ncbi:MAG: thioredoxin domain-containing protein [Desulfurococcales archaeon]|nr:thioredoxin domain-containing protein [Desulfurococcales archaeon]
MANKTLVKAFSILLVILMAGSAIMMLANGALGGGGSGEVEVKPVEAPEGGVVLDTGSRLFPNIPVPAVGPADARLQVYIFYSMFCPHCANEILNNLDYYLQLASEGTARIYFVDYPQQGAQELHAALRCLAKNNGPFLEAMTSLYRILAEDKTLPTMDDMNKFLEEKGITLDQACIEEELQNVARVASISYRTYNIQGTPTIVVYDTVSDKAYMVVGEQEREQLVQFINDVLEGRAG